MRQLTFSFEPTTCTEHSWFLSMATVPPTLVCLRCNTPLWQRLAPARDQPQELGFETADWVWHWRDGKAWTTL